MPDFNNAEMAAVKTINANGGVHGHPLKLVLCNDAGDNNQARTCANNAVANPSVIAEVYQNSYNSSSIIDPILSVAKMANAFLFVETSEDASCSVCFPLVPGGTVDAVAIAEMLYKVHHDKSVGIVSYNVAGGLTGMKSAKTNFDATVPGGNLQISSFPPTATDLSPYVQATASNKGEALLLGSSALITWLQTAKQLGVNQNFSTVASQAPAAAKALGSAMNGILIPADAEIPTTNTPGTNAYRAGMKKYYPSTALTQAGASGWAAVTAFGKVANSIKGSLTRASYLSAMGHLVNFSTGGIFPLYSTNKTFTGLGGAFPRMYNTSYLPTELENSQLVTIGKGGFIDAFTGKPVPTSK